jgi:hypothetical protein
MIFIARVDALNSRVREFPYGSLAKPVHVSTAIHHLDWLLHSFLRASTWRRVKEAINQECNVPSCSYCSANESKHSEEAKALLVSGAYAE